MKLQHAKDWQRNPDTLVTDKVQVWSKTGIMITANCPRSEARMLVINDKAFAICDQAIGFYE